MSEETIVYIEDEMKESYLDYSMSVIVSRALPDVRDGLKPVHRRILYAMNEMGMYHNKPHKKSARIVGEVLGKYHPHGDTAVYLTMVRMAQEFSYRYVLVDGHGNFGSIDGDSAAAMRYTEARMAKITQELLVDIKKDTIDYTRNFDDTLDEPEVLPARLPNLLLNGSSGIAVGMATNIPPHNLGELTDGIIKLIENPDIEIDELNSVITGPDFPTGGIINGNTGIRDAYRTGRGKLKIRSKVEIEQINKRKEAIIINELPYQVNKAKLIKKIADLVRDKKLTGITSLRDESDRDGIRVVIELKKDENPEILLNKLYKYTQMEVTFGIIMLALVNNEPKVLNLKEILKHYLNHRFEVITRSIKFDLNKLKKRAHLLEGFRIALDNIEAVIKTIRGSKDATIAKEKLIANFELSEEQAQAILDMKLQRLTGLEREKIETEYNEILKEVIRLEMILKDDGEIYIIIKKELEELKEKYDDGRRTEIIKKRDDIELEDLIEDEEVIVTLTNKGYVKRMSLDKYQVQKRGGKGKRASKTTDEDYIYSMNLASNLDTLMIFTNQGRVYNIKVYEIPKASIQARGKLIENIINLRENEKVQEVIKIREFSEDYNVLFLTKNGKAKKTKLDLYGKINKSGLNAIKLAENDSLVYIGITNGENEIFVATKRGNAIRFDEKEVKKQGRNTAGVNAVKLKENDNVVSGLIISNPKNTVLTLTEHGYGKQTKLSAYKAQSRAGVGLINLKVNKKVGEIVAVNEVEKTDEIMVITSDGIIIRTKVNTISTLGRATQGVKIMNVKENEKVMSVVKLKEEPEEKEDE